MKDYKDYIKDLKKEWIGKMVVLSDSYLPFTAVVIADINN